MSVLARDEVMRLIDKQLLQVTSSDPNHRFDIKQVTNSGIDLRLGLEGYVINPEAKILDTLAPVDIGMYYKRVSIGAEGFVIPPHGFLLTSTLEFVCLRAGGYIGRIVGRSTYARMGLSIHCTQPKFAGGNRSVVPLQLINHSELPMVVYPRQKIASMQLERVTGTGEPYAGSFADEVSIRLPQVPDSERDGYSKPELAVMFRRALTAEPSTEQSPVPPDGPAAFPPEILNFDVRPPKKSGWPRYLPALRAFGSVVVGGGLASAIFADPPSTSSDAMFWKSVATVLLGIGALVLTIVNARSIGKPRMWKSEQED